MGPVLKAQLWRKASEYRLLKLDEADPARWFIIPVGDDERKWAPVDVLRGGEHPLWLDFVNLGKPLRGAWPVEAAPLEVLEEFASRAPAFARRWGLLGLYHGAAAGGGVFGGRDDSLWSPQAEGEVSRRQQVPAHHVESVLTWARLAQELSELLAPMLRLDAEPWSAQASQRPRRVVRFAEAGRLYGAVRLVPVAVVDRKTGRRTVALELEYRWLLPVMFYLASLRAYGAQKTPLQVCADCGGFFLSKRQNTVYCEWCRLSHDKRSKGSRRRKGFREALRRSGWQELATEGSAEREALWDAYEAGGPSLMRQRAQELLCGRRGASPPKSPPMS